MRFSQSLLLASVAILTLPSCSSAQGPGEIGTKNDIVVRNYGDAPPPPSESMLQQEAATPPEMMAARTLQGEAPQIDDSEARALAAQHEAEVAAQAPQADAAQAQMQAAQQAEIQAQQQQAAADVNAQVPRAPQPTQMQQQALQQAQAQAGAQVQANAGLEAVPPPAVNEVRSLPEQSTQTMTQQDYAQAAADTTRATVVGDAPGETVAEVTSPVVEQAAEQYQNEGPEAAAAEALQNPPVSAANIVQEQQGQPATAPAAPASAPSPVAAPATDYGVRTSLRPTPADIAAGGMKVVTEGDGTMHAEPIAAAAPSAPVSAPAMPVEGPADASAPAPVSTPTTAADGAPVLDSAMISRAQTALTEKGFYTGPIDGEMSTAMLNALSRYQSANYLTPGGMTVETAQHLGLIQ